MLSVTLRVKMTSFVDPALMNSRTLRLVSS